MSIRQAYVRLHVICAFIEAIKYAAEEITVDREGGRAQLRLDLLVLQEVCDFPFQFVSQVGEFVLVYEHLFASFVEGCCLVGNKAILVAQF